MAGEGPTDHAGEQVEPEDERIGLFTPTLEPVNRGFHRASNARVLDTIRLEHRPIAQKLLPPGFPAARESSSSSGRRRPGSSSRRTPRREDLRAARGDRMPGPAPRSARQTLVQIPCRLRVRGNIRDQGGADPRIPKQVGQDRFVRAKRRPALIGIGKPIATGPPTSPCRQRGQVFGKVMVENDSLGRQPVEVGGLDPGIAIAPRKPRCKLLQTTTMTFMG